MRQSFAVSTHWSNPYFIKGSTTAHLYYNGSSINPDGKAIVQGKMGNIKTLLQNEDCKNSGIPIQYLLGKTLIMNLLGY